MKRLRAFLVAAFLATAVLLPITATPAFASITCPASASQHVGVSSNPILVVVYESQNYLSGYPDGHSLCIHVPVGGSTYLPNLHNIVYQTFALDDDNVCDGQFATSYGTWNDCISSVKMNSTCHYIADFFLDTLAQTWSFSLQGVQSKATLPNFNGQDDISSIKVTYFPTCPSAPAP